MANTDTTDCETCYCSGTGIRAQDLSTADREHVILSRCPCLDAEADRLVARRTRKRLLSAERSFDLGGES